MSVAKRTALAEGRDARRIAREEGMAAAREWRDFHKAAGTVWGIPPQPPAPCCSMCGKPL